MKRLILVLTILIIMLFYSVPSYSEGVFTHIGQAQDIIKMAKVGHPSVPPDIAAIITKSPETERAFRSGALDSDIFNALPSGRWSEPNTYTIGLDVSNLNRRMHERCSALIASIVLNNAKTDIEKAYAYGWALVHLPGDVIGHPLVNKYAGNGGQYGDNPEAQWDYNTSPLSGTNGIHADVEHRFDGYVLDKFVWL